MSIANILVYLNADRVSEPLINVAAGLVDKFSARLIGLSALSPIPAFAAERAVIVDTASQIDAKKLKISLDRVEHKFRGIAGTLRRVEWRSSLDAPLQALTTEARSADLIVLGQTKGPVDAYRTLDNGAAVIGAGRPTLIVQKPSTVF